MKTPLETRGSRANDGRSARLGKKPPDGTHAHRIAHARHSARVTLAGLRDAWGLRPGGSLRDADRRAVGVNQRARTRGISHSGRSGMPEVPSGWTFTPST